MRMQSGITTLEDSLTFSYKAKSLFLPLDFELSHVTCFIKEHVNCCMFKQKHQEPLHAWLSFSFLFHKDGMAQRGRPLWPWFQIEKTHRIPNPVDMKCGQHINVCGCECRDNFFIIYLRVKKKIYIYIYVYHAIYSCIPR